MSTICNECTIKELCNTDPEKYREGSENGLFLQVIQGLSGKMVGAVKGTRNGLNDERIEEIRREEVRAWDNIDDLDGEAAYLEAHPELAKAVHDCELRIQMGDCVIHSAQQAS